MDTQNSIVFLSVPESLRGRVESLTHHSHEGHEHEGGNHDEEDDEGFSIDPAIPIPVELPAGETTLDLETLSWEMILSGMIRVVTNHTLRQTDTDDEDIDYYRRFVLAVKPGIRGEFTEAAILKARNGDYDLALEISSALEGLFPQSPEVLLNRALILENRAEALERAGRDQEAETGNNEASEVYRRLLSQDRPFPNAFFNAGFFYMKRRDFDKARDCFTAYIPLSDDPEKQDKAAALVREIKSRNLDDETFREAYDFIRRGNEQQGLVSIRDFLERHSDVWNGWFILGWALRRLGRWEDGAAAFRKTIELGGDNSDTRNELAICLMEQGGYEAARKELETALRDDPENVKLISNLGVLAMKRGDDDEAAAFFRTVLEMEPQDPIALQGLAGLAGGL
ncbi:MAG: tetratricopeptide repeat protein [Treponema sp.]|jgi:tetratricopeptide (TPR) repeat protein|nr:tetratricopeptide repeat protein [Treponema sp.]